MILQSLMRDQEVSRVALLLACFAPAACSEPEETEVPDYARSVAPLLEKHCVRCHSTGMVAPFAIETYADARDFGPALVAAVQARTMPPWNPDNSGACQTYSNARWMSDEEIATFTAWVDAGMPEGERRGPLVAPTTEPLALTVELGMTEPYTPAGTAEHPMDDYRCFVVPGFAAPTFVTGFQLSPGELAQVHHVIGYAITDPSAEATFVERDAAAPGPGFSCFGGLVDDGVLGVFGWAPGSLGERYPAGVGVEIPAAGSLVLEVHYNLAAGARPDLTRVAFEVAPQVEWPVLLFGYDDLALRLEPGLSAAKHEHSFRFTDLGLDEPMLAFGVGPHMHTRGRTQRLVVERPDGTSTCLMDVPRWDFHWQDSGLYTEPVPLGPDDLLHTTCTYDTRGDQAPIAWGENTDDEMCLSSLFLARANGRPWAELLE